MSPCKQGVTKVIKDNDRSFEGLESVKPGPGKWLHFFASNTKGHFGGLFNLWCLKETTVGSFWRQGEALRMLQFFD